jgi:hypothetical protein
MSTKKSPGLTRDLLFFELKKSYFFLGAAFLAAFLGAAFFAAAFLGAALGAAFFAAAFLGAAFFVVAIFLEFNS